MVALGHVLTLHFIFHRSRKTKGGNTCLLNEQMNGRSPYSQNKEVFFAYMFSPNSFTLPAVKETSLSSGDTPHLFQHILQRLPKVYSEIHSLKCGSESS